MEIFKIIKHTDGGADYLRNAVNYLTDGREVMKAGIGVTANNTAAAYDEFLTTAKYFNHQENNPLFHFVISFDRNTVDSSETAMNQTKKIYEKLTEDHQALISIHHSSSESPSYHSHTVMSSTNFVNGNLFYGSNSDLFPIAQRIADITQDKCTMIIEKDKKTGRKEFRKMFYPHKD